MGDDTHHTLFEMLGNFAFGGTSEGGYFKPEAIAYGYEFVTKHLGISPDRVWATTWAGEEGAGLPPDEELVALWRATGVPSERIRPLNEKPEGGRENFWGPTGASGPCGPCTEIHVDLLGRCPLGATDAECGPEHGCGRIVEIWNLVFNQYFQEPDGTLRPLSRTGVDTGAGFERIVSYLQGVPSAYESDLLRPVVQAAEALLDAPYGQDEQITRSLRIVTDHTRAVTFMIGDGVLPSNVERGYVARRLLRRAVRYGRLLGRQGPFMAPLAGAVIERFGEQYPHLVDRRAVIERVIAQEEARFSETLNAGTQLLNSELDRLASGGERTLSGATAFRLYNTFGFPLELTEEVAQGRGFQVDGEGFATALEDDRRRAREGQRFTTAAGGVELPDLQSGFEGYEQLTVPDARILYLRQGQEQVATAEASLDSALPGAPDSVPDGAPSGDDVWVVLDRTPFYAERGGQVGDCGWITGPHGRLRVRTTQAPAGDLIVHLGRVESGSLSEGDEVRAEVDAPAREATMRHHTATHLLHAALRAELGPHVHQTGSLVAPDRLRFDFSHGDPLTPQQRLAVQGRINEAIRRNLPVRTDVMPVDEAMRSGAVALFDERYGDTVRVLTIGDVSKELCGGTHVRQTGEIGEFVFTTEGSIGSGTRRVEALAGGRRRTSSTASWTPWSTSPARWRCPPRRCRRGCSACKGSWRRPAGAWKGRSASWPSRACSALLGQASQIDAPGGPFRLLAVEVDPAAAPTMERLREVADWLRDKLDGPSVLLLASVPNGSPQLLATVSKALTGQGLHAGQLLNEVADAIGGRAGGRPDMAQGGGGDYQKLPQGLERGRQAVRARAGAE